MGKPTLAAEIGDYLGESETWRMWSLAAQDGIISTAGILLGFAGAGADAATLLVAGQSAIVAGMLTAGGAQWSERAAEREAERNAIAEERGFSIQEHALYLYVQCTKVECPHRNTPGAKS